MYADVDQSGRIDQTNKPTVLAVANGVTYTILITSRDKQRILLELKRLKPTWSTATINVLVFSTLLFLLLKDHLEKLSLVIVDTEFPGHEALIKDRVMSLCRKEGIKVHKDQIAFAQVGKKSPSHIAAWRVYNAITRPDRIIRIEEILGRF